MNNPAPFPDLSNVQGNSLAAFNKNHQRFLFFEIADVGTAKRWIGDAADNLVCTAQEVRIFNDAFKQIKRLSAEPLDIAATWTVLAFTSAGLKQLGLQQTDAAGFEQAFNDDIRARTATAAIGDQGESAPANWEAPYQGNDLHMLAIVASDSPQLLEERCEHVIDTATQGGFTLAHREDGEAREDKPGFEHFGYKDGVSQPRPQAAQGDDASTDGTSSWEFVINAASPQLPPPSQPPASTPGALGYPTPTPPAPAPPPSGTPTPWMHEGSYVVFRKLRQRLPQFNAFVQQTAASVNMTPERFGASMVGRYKSGFPLAHIPTLPQYVPTAGDPTEPANVNPPLTYDESVINAFDYTGDTGGQVMPKGAHIQKTNPRIGAAPFPRIMRRGIAYGQSYNAESDPNGPCGPDADRGLLFVSYQASLEAQFEFINRNWINNAAFQGGAAGQDPLVGQSATQCTFQVPSSSAQPMTLPAERWILSRGTLYLFQPSIAGLKHLATP